MTDPVEPATPFARFVAPARRYPALWRLFAGLALIALTYLCWTFVVGIGAVYLAHVRAGPGWADGFARLVAADARESAATTALVLVTFPGAILGAWITVRWLHRRSLASIFGRPQSTAIADFVKGAAITLVAAGAVTLLGLLAGEAPARSSLAFSQWLVWLVPLLALLALQVTAEEIVFRGYLTQQLAARFRSPLVWVLVPASLFAVLHFDPSHPAEAQAAVIAVIFLFALTTTALVWRTGGLWASIGAHAGNNAAGLVLFGTEGDRLGGALFVYPPPARPEDFLLPGLSGLCVLAWVLSPLPPFSRGRVDA